VYGGRASDEFITSDSDELLQHLESSKGSVMADRGFLISGILNDMGEQIELNAYIFIQITDYKASSLSFSRNACTRSGP
jgi:hypothetical protein